MRYGRWLRALLADISHYLGDARDGGCDFHRRPPRWRELRDGSAL